MDVRALQSTEILAAAVATAATLVLAVQLISPSPVLVSAGENGATVTELSGYFTYTDVAVILVAATALGASAVYLLLAGQLSAETKRAASRQPTTQEPPQHDNETVNLSTATERTEDLLDARREEWQATADRLSDNECVVYNAVLEADGVLAQSDIVDQTDISKASVSRALDSLEVRDLVERKRRGIGNVVMLL